MATITLEYDAQNKIFVKMIDLFLTAGAKIKDSSKSGYDAKFVEKIRKAEKQQSKKINLKSYGINI